MESERLPRGADPRCHTKLGPGGLTDVEWTVQLLQMRHAGRVPGLRTTRTREAARGRPSGRAARPTEQAQILDEAWRAATRVRNAVMLVRGRAGDTLPNDLRELAAVARVLGYPPGAAERWSTTTGAPPGAPGRWWSSCSTGDGVPAARAGPDRADLP